MRFTPALHTITLGGRAAYAARYCAHSRSVSDDDDTSPVPECTAGDPSVTHSAATACSASALRPVRNNEWPRDANARAVAAPTPDDAPVMITRRDAIGE